MNVLNYLKKRVFLPLVYLPILVFADPSLNTQNDCVYASYDEGYWGNQEEACCENNQFWECLKVPLIGVASGIGGGIIGAEIVGGKRGHRGDRGPSGPQGPQGPSGTGFTPDTGQALTFTLTALFPASPAGSVSTRPFVTSPTGETIEGPVVISPTAGGTINYAPIVFQNPVFGFYNFGIAVENTSATTLNGISLNGTLVTASRDGSITSELTPLAGVSIAPGQNQISSTFTYDNANVP